MQPLVILVNLAHLNVVVAISHLKKKNCILPIIAQLSLT